MKRIINGKKYDTETATSLLSKSGGLGRETELYVTKKKNYFLVHWTNWQNENDYIEPISKEEAKEFCERKMDAEKFEKEFGKCEEA